MQAQPWQYYSYLMRHLLPQTADFIMCAGTLAYSIGLETNMNKYFMELNKSSITKQLTWLKPMLAKLEQGAFLQENTCYNSPKTQVLKKWE